MNNIFNDNNYCFVEESDETTDKSKNDQSLTVDEEKKTCESKVHGKEQSEMVMDENKQRLNEDELEENKTEHKIEGTEDTCSSKDTIKSEMEGEIIETITDKKCLTSEIEESEDCTTNETVNDDSNNTSETASDENKSIVSKLFVHSQWLSVQSSYFKSLFYSGLKETYSKEVVMKIYEHELQAHLTLIEAMYIHDVLNDKDYKLIVQILVLAHKYDVHILSKKCKYVLLSITPNLTMCEYILREIKHLPDTADIYEMLEKFLVKEFTSIDKTWTMDKFTDLSEPALRLLLGSDHLPTKSENTIFVALMDWVEVNIGLLGCESCDVLNVLRFEFMSPDFLYDIVRNHSIAKRMPGFDEHLLKGLAYHGFSNLRREQLKPQPKKRPLVNDSDPTFSWVIDDELGKKLRESPEETFYSDIFWHQGYKMRLSLEYCDESDESSCNFFLAVLDLTDTSSVHVSYDSQSNLFASRTLEMGKTKYTSESSNWGCDTERSQMLRGEGFTIDVWVTVY